jgi:2-dehydro-3-deoxy-D-gluconate 5-dehydrogenase
MSVSGSFSLEGKVALVTGANKGLGRGFALGFAEAGADVACVYRSNPGDTAEQIEKMGRKAVLIKADLSVAKPDAAKSIIDQCVSALGGINVLVNNAGTIHRQEVSDFSEEGWNTVMNTNLKSLFFLSQAAARTFISQGNGGKIINIASMLSFQGGIRVISYTTSKHGVMGVTKAMANEMAVHNIQVNAIAPGYMATDNTMALQNDPVRNREILVRIPAGRWGTPEDLQGAAVFLASGASDYVTGHTLAVDGGWLSR